MRYISQKTALGMTSGRAYKSSGKQLVTKLLRTLSSLFASLYKSCDKSKDKYMKFQLEWHQCFGVFLVPADKELSDVGVDAKKNVDLACLQQRWVWILRRKISR